MATLAPASFLSHLKELYPVGQVSGVLGNPWYIPAVVAYSASNKPEAVPQVFEFVLQELKANQAPEAEQYLLAQKTRDALLKAGLTSGYPRAINSLKALHDVMPEELKAKRPERDFHAPLTKYEKIGESFFEDIYGGTAKSVQTLLDDIYPDMGQVSRVIGYGLIYGYSEVLPALETSYTLVASLIAGDTPLQISWHLNGARRRGATLEQVRAVREISIEVARRCGVVSASSLCVFANVMRGGCNAAQDGQRQSLPANPELFSPSPPPSPLTTLPVLSCSPPLRCSSRRVSPLSLFPVSRIPSRCKAIRPRPTSSHRPIPFFFFSFCPSPSYLG